MIKGSILQEDITILSKYVFNKSVSNYTRRKMLELQGEIDVPIVVVEDARTDPTGRKSLRTN